MQFGLFGGARTKPGVEHGDSQGYRDFIDYVLEAEDLGFSSCFLVEHHFTGVGQVSASLNLLTYLAARTRTMRLGTAVVVLPWHNPVLLAEQVATADLLSNGRLDFGVGKGYRKNEFAGFCIPMEEAQERFEEALVVLRKALGGERFSHHGKRWHFDNVIVEPAPVQRPHPPIWMAAGTADSIRRAAGQGFNLLVDQIGSIDLTIQRLAVYRAELERLGQPFHGSRVGVTRGLHMALSVEDRGKVRAARMETLKRIGDLARPLNPGDKPDPGSFADGNLAGEDAALLGTPDEIITRLRRLQAGGVETVLLVDPTGSREALRVFAREIMPEFRPMPAPVPAK
jgi:alkanesulfonate monooxygenase SsuD/methylene tetrahydromethanopterin reductase-like flavin-dependent oxidoreductase (luciferase family)